MRPLRSCGLAALPLLFAALGVAAQAQQNSTQNSGDCTVLVQGSNNNITISNPCTPTKNLQLAQLTGSGQAAADGKQASALQFTIREFVLDGRSHTLYVSVAAVNHAAEPAYAQLITAISSIQLSDPPASIHIEQVAGLGSCRVINNPVRQCLEKATDMDSTEIPPGGTLGFRLIGRAPRELDVTPQTGGALSLAFMRKVGNKYEKLDLSFLDVKLNESR